MSSPAQLCEELHKNANVAGNRPLERRLADLAVWYYKTAFFVPPENLKTRVDLLHKALWVQMELNALLLERIHEMEGSKNLWLPKGLDVHGDLSSFA